MNKLRFGLSLVLASACALLPAGAASAASGVVGQVYVNDNTRGVNTVAGERKRQTRIRSPSRATGGRWPGSFRTGSRTAFPGFDEARTEE